MIGYCELMSQIVRVAQIVKPPILVAEISFFHLARCEKSLAKALLKLGYEFCISEFYYSFATERAFSLLIASKVGLPRSIGILIYTTNVY